MKIETKSNDVNPLAAPTDGRMPTPPAIPMIACHAIAIARSVEYLAEHFESFCNICDGSNYDGDEPDITDYVADRRIHELFKELQEKLQRNVAQVVTLGYLIPDHDYLQRITALARMIEYQPVEHLREIADLATVASCNAGKYAEIYRERWAKPSKRKKKKTS